MSDRRNFYQILHVQPDAPMEIVHTSYRAVMHVLRMHPDLGGDHEKAALINEAFATLSNPEKRAEYDRTLLNEGGEKKREPKALPGDAPAKLLNSSTTMSKEITWRSCAFCRRPYAAVSADAPDATCEYCQSPLFQATRHEGLTTTRRALDRVPRRMRVLCAEASRPDFLMEMTTVDVSVDGMRLSSPYRLLPGQRLRLQCSFCHAVGVVTYVAAESLHQSDRWHVGVQFLTLKVTQARGVFLSLQV
jgi:hypothetical protein